MSTVVAMPLGAEGKRGSMCTEYSTYLETPLLMRIRPLSTHACNRSKVEKSVHLEEP